MKMIFRCALLSVFPLAANAAQPWQEVTLPTVAEAAATFANPPKEYGAIHWALGFPPPKERILADIEHVAANGGGGYMINSGGPQPKYLSPEYMDLFKYAVDELKKRGLKMWIDGDDGYPDGFAGGMINRDYPQLGMQTIIADCHYTVAGGQTLNIPLPNDTLGIVARASGAAPARGPAAPGAGAAAPFGASTLVPVAAPGARGAPGAAPGARGGAGGARGGAGGARGGAAGGRGGAPGVATTVPATQNLPVPADGKLKWTAPGSTVSGVDRNQAWEVVIQSGNVEGRYSLVPGQTLSITIPPDTKTIQAGVRAGGAGGGAGGRGGAGGQATIIPLPADGQLKWTAPGTGTWDVTFVRHTYKSSPTRAGQRADGTRDKDSLYCLIDYLDPEATATYLKLVQESYAKAAGDEFGKTILGFRGDETDFTGVMPWTPKLLETFQAKKGYDLKPYLVQFFGGGGGGADIQRVRADYADVWSGMFRDNFYKPMQDWCRAHNMDYMVHLNHEEAMTQLVASEGSFFRDMRYMGVPGVDNLNQIGPNIVADFPKLAGSTAHLFGRPQVWTESGGDFSANGKFVFDYQLVRGINYMNIRGLNNAAPAAGAAPDPTIPTGWYFSRAQHLMAIGRPAAQVAFYHPTDSLWMGDREADTATVKLVTQLMEQQIDFDHIDQDSLATDCALEGGGLKNLSGQVYRAVIVPSSTVIQKNVLERLRAFAAAGGKVVFVGRTPTLIVDKSYLHPESGAPDLSFATLETTEAITAKVVAALPKPDVKLDAACAPVKYMHRALKDGEVYLFFNESDQKQARTATLAGTGQVQVWDAMTGKIGALAGVGNAQGSVAVPLNLAAHEARFIVIGPLAAVNN